MKLTSILGMTVVAGAMVMSSCNNGHKTLPAVGDTLVEVFDSVNICFRPEEYGNYVAANEQGIIRLANGRIILKKINIPEYKRDVTITANVTVSSNGDRWDKSGSFFVLPKDAAINLLSVAKDEAKYPAIDSTRYEKLVGVVADTDYKPIIELIRFMTPFGVGYYSSTDDSLSQRRKPVYIDSWAKEVNWEEDITSLYPALEGEVYVGAFIDTWTPEGYMLSAEIQVEESDIECNAMPNRKILPVVNTIYYMGQEYPDIFSRQDLVADFEMPADAKNVKLNYIVTGHGGHAGGDEFVPRQNIVSVDGDTILNFVPWRDDCHTVRRYNPATGVWLIEREASYISENGYAVKKVQEPLGSSDKSRSNWCPGTDVPPVVETIGDLTAGKHQLTVSIPEAQPIDGSKLNHWLVSAYLTWDE